MKMKTTFSYCKSQHAVCAMLNPGGITLPLPPCAENLVLIENVIHCCGRYDVCNRAEAFNPNIKEVEHGKRN